VAKSDTNTDQGVVIIGDNSAAIQAALTLARLGIAVKVITSSAAMGWDNTGSCLFDDCALDKRYLWPLLLRAVNHPLITFINNAVVENIEGEEGNFKVRILQQPRYVNPELCTACGRCEAECSARVITLSGDQKITHTAIHTPLLGLKSIPSACVIDKNEVAPCRIACPLGINVQGFVSLLSKGKPDKALALINESAPLAGILGRVCRNACEGGCNRAQVDTPVSIRALHRHAADNASVRFQYSRKAPAKSRSEKIAIVGSGPAGLTAAWELTRRGYTPTVFESHSVIGGMLATGIPRFRLPREIREREIEAIKNFGVDIRTGITVGRDITYSYLKERGYQAFFLSIGSQQENKLNIPGEEVDGVVDCMSLLLALNLKVDTFVGSNVAVVGGGNAAIDAARSVLRSGAEKVTIYYRRNRSEMPANDEEVEEALEEGVKIEFNVVPVEVLQENGKVSGLRCQRTKLNNGLAKDGRSILEMVPDSDFTRDADHVVVAIGQMPNASQLDIHGLDIDGNDGVIKVNPLTLETSIPGVFAGGDCTTGPNTVVDAMAAGLRAAESIDRYFMGLDLDAERSFEPPKAAEIDLETMEITPYKRAKMPSIRPKKRITSFEETTTGLPLEDARREAQRCLNCAQCSQCLECVDVCELGALCHEDNVKQFEVGARVVLQFPSNNEDNETDDRLAEAMALALETAADIKPGEMETIRQQSSAAETIDLIPTQDIIKNLTDSKRIGVILCRCGGSVSSVIDFKAITRRLAHLSDNICIGEVTQSCTEEGARQIADQVAKWQVGRVVLAACRCCNSEQVCYSCTDRRTMCQHYLCENNVLPSGTIVEFCNIREQCAWVHKDDPRGATNKALQIISSAVARVGSQEPLLLKEEPILSRVLIVGGSIAGVIAARALTARGYHVELFSDQELLAKSSVTGEVNLPDLEQCRQQGMVVRLLPDSLQLNGSPGQYKVMLQYGSRSDSVDAGALLIEVKGVDKEASPVITIQNNDGLLDRIMKRRENANSDANIKGDLLREITIGDTSGIFWLPTAGDKPIGNQVLLGLAMAARISAYLEQTKIKSRVMAVNIDSQLCRGCGDCAAVCSYIEMQERGDGTVRASVDKTLCLGCGACIATCPTGAITQPWQSDQQMVATLQSLLQPHHVASEV